jgi:hypothetical protein
MSHSCAVYTLDHHFEGKDPAVRALFDGYAASVERCGPFDVVSQKTRIVFMVRVRFAGVMVRNYGLQSHIWLKRRTEHPLFTKTEHFLRNDYVYTFKLTSMEQLDDDSFFDLMREAYDVGCQKHLYGAETDESS